MTSFAAEYADGLYALAREERIEKELLEQAQTLSSCFDAQPAFVALLSNRAITLNERLKIISDTLGARAHMYMLNFIMLLCQRGGLNEFSACVTRFRANYYAENNIAEATATVARALTPDQRARLCDKLRRITGKTIMLIERIDENVLGGIRVDVDGRRIDNTIQNRLELLKRSLSADA